MEYVLRQARIKNEAEDKARAAIQPGMILYGYCCGYFGRDSYEDKLVIDIIGDHIEVRDENGVEQIAEVKSWMELLKSSNEELQKREKHETA